MSNFKAVGRFGRNVLDEVLGKALADLFRDEVHHETVAVRKLESLIHPSLCLGRKLRRQLARRKHDLMVAVGQMIAAYVHIVELIIQANFLGLAVCLQQRPPVPEADIVYRFLVSGDVVQSKVGQCWILLFFNLVELKGFPREIYIVFQVGGLALQLAGLDPEFLN